MTTTAVAVSVTRGMTTLKAMVVPQSPELVSCAVYVGAANA